MFVQRVTHLGTWPLVGAFPFQKRLARVALYVVVSMASLRAVLFDLDGTICDSDHLHFAAWRDELAAARDSFELSYQEYKSRISGKPNALIAQEFLPHLNADERSTVCMSKESRFRALASDGDSLAPLDGLLDLIAFLQSRNIRIACVTNAPRINAEFMLRQMNLSAHMEHLIIGEECLASKPSPEPYFEAMRRLNVAADSCVIFEDSASGLAAACASGCALAVGVCTTHSADALRLMGAKAAVLNFSLLNFDALLQLHAAEAAI